MHCPEDGDMPLSSGHLVDWGVVGYGRLSGGNFRLMVSFSFPLSSLFISLCAILTKFLRDESVFSPPEGVIL